MTHSKKFEHHFGEILAYVLHERVAHCSKTNKQKKLQIMHSQEYGQYFAVTTEECYGRMERINCNYIKQYG